ncbi:MAG TPA: C-terminal binding protein [Alphaproteobacteria bacterium]|nr:C-terminal binding protein [Alphaproteobacteria bacterium]
MKVIRTDRELECPGIDAGLIARGADLVTLPSAISEDELAREASDAVLLLMCYTPISGRIIDEAKRLKGIVKYGVGIDAIDIAAARRRGIPVVNVPEYAEESVAEGAFALLIALAKRLPAITRAVQREGWIWPEARWLGQDIAGKTLALVGAGRIARSLARMAKAGFRARVLAYDPYVDADTMRAAGIEKHDDFGGMLAAADFVSVHCVLNETTRHLIGAAEIARLKRSAILINVSRGAVVDEAALVRAVVDGRVAGVGLDVFEREPLAREGHPLSALYGRDNVILFPHLTFYTHEAMRRLEEDTLARCFEILEGRPVLVRSRDPRLRAQSAGVTFG